MNITWEAAKTLAPKERDTWVRALFLNWWATYAVYYLARSRLFTPMSLTVFGFLVGIYAAFSFFRGDLITGAVLYFVHFILDGLDGKLSRVRGEDDTVRGMWDLTCDGVVFVCVVLGLAARNFDLAWFLLVWLGIHFIDMRMSSIVYKFRGDLGIQEDRLITDSAKEIYGKSRIVNVYSKVQRALDRWRVNAIPTVGEGAFLAFVVAPIVWHFTGDIGWQLIAVWMGTALTLPGTFGYSLMGVKLAAEKRRRSL